MVLIQKKFQSLLDVPRETVNLVVHRLTTAPIPLVFWAGYSSLVLVSSLFSKKWSVVISDNPLTRVYPRRWLDIVGIRVADYWDAALRAVMGVVIFRPGITQVSYQNDQDTITPANHSISGRASLALAICLR